MTDPPTPLLLHVRVGAWQRFGRHEALCQLRLAITMLSIARLLPFLRLIVLASPASLGKLRYLTHIVYIHHLSLDMSG
jgi:hypothetical protein